MAGYAAASFGRCLVNDVLRTRLPDHPRLGDGLDMTDGPASESSPGHHRKLKQLQEADASLSSP